MDHVHGPDCDHEHDHTHGGHGHDHDHGSAARDYYLGQLLTILICGAYGVVALLMFRADMLKHILVPEFWRPIAIAGTTIFVLALVRGIAVWIEAGKPFAHDDCGHDHGPGDDHSHGSGIVYIQVLVLAFPLLLFVWGLPNSRISAERINSLLSKATEVEGLSNISESGTTNTSFEELNGASLSSGMRTILEGKRCTLTGKARILGEKQFTLYHLKMNCCAADMVPLEAAIVAEFAINSIVNADEYSVSGVIQFAEKNGKPGQFTPVIRVTKPEEITPTSTK